MERYSVIHEKNPREIVLLRGSGCRWRRCTFCDYHLDYSRDIEANALLNREVLSRVTGIHEHLEVINSGSFVDLDEKTMEYIQGVCVRKRIRTIHFESHWNHREAIPALREAFAELGVTVKIKIGVETFDALYREEILKKGITESEPALIAADFDECCLLFGLHGQTVASMRRDIETGLEYFERVCVNIMVENSTKIKPDMRVIEQFCEELYPEYIDNPRVDILLENTDFGVGGEEYVE
ncbi:MAG: radical SAM protein [Lachnospiraceae bacterium]